MQSLSMGLTAALVGALGCNSGARTDRATAPTHATAPAQASEASVGDEADTASELPQAEAQLTAASGATIQGNATFTAEPGGVRVILEIDAAPPGKKGVHVHERGDCSDIAGKSMGPHFAPKLEQHALPSEGVQRHLGDLGNIEVDASGKGRLEIKVVDASLGSDTATSFLGRAIVVHAGEDAGSLAQPAGGSGAPMACGVIHEPRS